MRDVLLKSLDIIVTILLPVLATWLASVIVQHIKDKRLAGALTLLNLTAADVVAEIYQATVSNLKDPSKPGEWTEAAAVAAKSVAMAKLRALAPEAVALLTAARGDPSTVDAALSAAIERAVVELRAHEVPMLRMAAVDVDPLLVPPTPAPPADKP